MRIYSHLPHPMVLAAMSRKPAGGGVAPLANTLSLNHFEGADGATTTSDEVGGVTWAFAVGANAIDTAQFKFGSSSAYVQSDTDALTYTGISLDVSLPWTLEFFLRRPGNVAMRIRLRNSSNQLLAHILTATNSCQLQLYNAGSLLTTVSGTPTLTTNTWYHIAVCSDGDNQALFFNGNRLGTTNQATHTGTATKGDLIDANFVGGWIDEFRISDVERYTGATYTVPTAAFT